MIIIMIVMITTRYETAVLGRPAKPVSYPAHIAGGVAGDGGGVGDDGGGDDVDDGAHDDGGGDGGRDDDGSIALYFSVI